MFKQALDQFALLSKIYDKDQLEDVSRQILYPYNKEKVEKLLGDRPKPSIPSIIYDPLYRQFVPFGNELSLITGVLLSAFQDLSTDEKISLYERLKKKEKLRQEHLKGSPFYKSLFKKLKLKGDDNPINTALEEPEQDIDLWIRSTL